MQRIQNRFGTAGLVVAIVALVAAMSGGAYAAAHASKAKPLSQAQIIKLIKKYVKAGPAGAAGTNGTNGAAGSNGTDGTDGANGLDGKTVLNGTAVPTVAVGSIGDFYIRTTTSDIYGPKAASGANGGWGNPTSLKGAQGDPGNDGSPWVAGTAPSGAVLTGTWAIPQYTAAAAGEQIPVPISTGVPIPTGALFTTDFVPPGGPDPAGQGCDGSAASPTPPAAGNEIIVCVYEETATNLSPPGLFNNADASSGGGIVALPSSAAAGIVKGYGSWALRIG